MTHRTCPREFIDDLTFTYDGNQVTKIEDAAIDPTYNGAFNFNDGASQTDEYVYDKNGNLTKDLNKNILSVQYNSLNLPSRINYQNGNYVTYTYSAEGERLTSTFNVGTTQGSSDPLCSLAILSTFATSLMWQSGKVAKWQIFIKKLAKMVHNSKIICIFAPKKSKQI